MRGLEEGSRVVIWWWWWSGGGCGGRRRPEGGGNWTETAERWRGSRRGLKIGSLVDG